MNQTTPQATQAPRQRPRPVLRAVQVKRAERPTPNLIRVTLTGAELEGFATAGPAEHIRLWFPQAGYERPVMPEWTDNGTVMPEGHARPDSRVYTPMRWNPDVLELDVDFVIHEPTSGPGSAWAVRAKPGDHVVVSGPGGRYRVAEDAEWFVLAGDHSALPAIDSILKELPATARARVYAEVPSHADELPLTSLASIEVTWLHSDPASPKPGAALEATLRSIELPAGNARVFVACEAMTMRDIRRHLLYERGLPREVMHTHGYWKQGVAAHPDHDLGDDV
jgi:NADPH-dependent ferric siderophore reductase